MFNEMKINTLKLEALIISAILFNLCEIGIDSKSGTKQVITPFIASFVIPTILKSTFQINTNWKVSYPYPISLIPQKVSIKAGKNSDINTI
jgi:hypothetical protein